VARTLAKTDTGWPMRLVRARVGGGAGMLALYAFLEHAATVWIQSADAATLDARADEIARVLRAAGPEFRGEEIVALAELVDLAPTERAPGEAPRAPEERIHERIDEDGVRALAIETIRPRDPAAYPMWIFRLVDEQGAPLPVCVCVETSDYARERGAPYVLSVTRGDQYRVIGAREELPPYPELRATALEILRESIAPG
jgi:hypothetical protein